MEVGPMMRQCIRFTAMLSAITGKVLLNFLQLWRIVGGRNRVGQFCMDMPSWHVFPLFCWACEIWQASPGQDMVACSLGARIH
eukprot:1145125-Pelagomonas_calceolata.AAC.9